MAMMEEALCRSSHHRYQVESTASALVVSTMCSDARRGRTGATTRSRGRAECALNALTATLRLGAGVPAAALEKVRRVPQAIRVIGTVSAIHGLPFDPVTPGLVAADLTIQFVLAPIERHGWWRSTHAIPRCRRSTASSLD